MMVEVVTHARVVVPVVCNQMTVFQSSFLQDAIVFDG